MSGKVIHLNSDNFDKTVNSDKPVLVDFWATWCGPCRMLGPTIEALAEEMGDKALVCKLDVDQAPEIADEFGITAVPTLIFFRKGQKIGTSPMASKDELKARLEQLA